MADISQDTFDRTKNRKSVVTQIGTPFIDSQDNESQKIIFVEQAENAAACMSSLRATASGPMRFPYTIGDSFKPYATGTAAIFVKAGVAYIDGYQIVLGTDINLTTSGLTFPTVGGSAIFGYIYADIVLEEVDSTADPSMIIPNVGESAVRTRLRVDWKKSESTISFEAAFNAITPLPDGGTALWNGNTARFFLCRYFRNPGASTISNSDLLDMRQSPPGEACGKQPFIKLMTASGGANEGNGQADSFVVWMLLGTAGALTIGVGSSASSVDAVHTGLRMSNPGGADQYITRAYGVVWKQTGAGNTNGTKAQVSGTAANSWLLNDGDALGFLTDGVTLTRNSQRLSKPQTAGALLDVTPTPGSFTPSPLFAQKLVVATRDTFGNTSDPGTFILVTRVGDDLVWWNGHVTRGDSTQFQLDEPTLAPTEWNAVVGRAKSTLTQTYGIEEMMYFLQGTDAEGQNFGTVSTRAFVKRGSWRFSRNVHIWGDINFPDPNLAIDTYSSDNSSFTLVGESPGVTQLLLANPDASVRNSADIGVFNVAAHKISLKGLTFDATDSSTFKSGYTLILDAYHVELEDCHFYGPVMVRANTISIKSCRFEGKTTTYTNFADNASNEAVAHCLLLNKQNNGETDVEEGNWTLRNNRFYINNETVSTHGALIIRDSYVYGTIEVDHCQFKYNGATATMPAINVLSKESTIKIEGCRFTDARGVLKVGNVSTETFPFNGSWNGAPLQGSTSKPLQDTATGYISVGRGRNRTSRLVVRHNHFDLGKCGANSWRFTCWGALMVVFNHTTVENNSSAVFANIEFSKNDVNLATDDAVSTVGWDVGGSFQPCLWGVGIIRTLQDSSTLTNVIVESISIEDNTFKLGNGTTTAWRMPLGSTSTTAPASPNGLMYVQPAPINVQLSNRSGSSGAMCIGLSVKNNKILQTQPSGAAQPPFATLATTAQFVGILVSGSFYNNVANSFFSATSVTEAPVAPHQINTSTGGVLFPVIEGNTIIASQYTPGSTSGQEGCAGIDIGNSYGADVNGNNIYLYSATTGSFLSVGVTGAADGPTDPRALRTAVRNNRIKAIRPVQLVASYAYGNITYGCFLDDFTIGGAVSNRFADRNGTTNATTGHNYGKDDDGGS